VFVRQSFRDIPRAFPEESVRPETEGSASPVTLSASRKPSRVCGYGARASLLALASAILAFAAVEAIPGTALADGGIATGGTSPELGIVGLYEGAPSADGAGGGEKVPAAADADESFPTDGGAGAVDGPPAVAGSDADVNAPVAEGGGIDGGFPANEDTGNREGARETDGSRILKIIAGSTLLADIARDLLGPGTVIHTLVPPQASPAGTDLKAADTAFAAEADLLLVHGFQADPGLFDELVRSSGNGGLRMISVRAAGSWQVPDSQRRASEETADVLARAVPGRAGLVRVRLARRLKALDGLESEVRVLVEPFRGVPVAASEMQAWFLSWAGLDVAWSFGGARSPGEGPPAPPPAGLHVDLVVGDLQTGGGAEEAVARALDAPLEVLSSFPEAQEDSPDYFTLVRGNVRRLSAALRRPYARTWRPL
jgi:hypothetical protein